MKKFLPDLFVILIFITISYIYFFPAVTEGRIVFQHDTTAGVGASQEIKEYYETTGERSRWTNSMFGGMPTYQISPTYNSTQPLRFMENIYHLFLPNYVWLTFVMMLGFYILLRSLGVSAWLSGLGGFAWGFSSYFFILISAGHLWKFITLAYIPPTIAGIVLIYRKQYIIGAILTALFGGFQILSNHIQMTYYFMFVILFMVAAFFVDAYRKKEIKQFLKASVILVAAGLIGISTNISTLYHTYEYSKETMRGKSELTLKTDPANQTDSGLERDYITNWSYGIGETFTLLVPNTKGGASVSLGANKKAMEKANPMYRQIYNQLSQYWGNQPGTSGPVYVGAFVLMLFILGLFIVKGPLKWALLATTILSILLSWGKNFMGFTDFFIDYIPMYSKFRAVSSILVIAEFTIPLLAILALKEIIEKPRILIDKIKYIYISFGLTGGIAFLFAVAPRLFFSNYIPDVEMAQLSQIEATPDQIRSLINNLEEVRIHLFTSDAWRSFFIVLAGTLILMLYRFKPEIKSGWIVGAIALLCLIDLWPIDKRYLNDSQFVPKTAQTTTFRMTEADKFILQDSSPDYRVLNLSTNTFNENNTSYWHKSIGGYHAAKLRRYQEIIDTHITKDIRQVFSEVANAGGNMEEVNPEMFRTLNMLNTRYIIFPTSETPVPIFNPYAYGNAWFVENVEYVNSADDEINALNRIDPLQTAVAHTEFRNILGDNSSIQDTLSYIRLTSYAPNKLLYESSSITDGIGVFSEIYYPTGWKITIDGDPVDMGRVNYILRALRIPAGEHVIEMYFNPTSIKITEAIAYVGIGLLLLGIVILGILFLKKIRLPNRAEK